MRENLFRNAVVYRGPEKEKKEKNIQGHGANGLTNPENVQAVPSSHVARAHTRSIEDKHETGW